MTATDIRTAGAPDVRSGEPSPFVGLDWSSIIAGAVAAAALAFVLHSFATAIGLATSSTAPTWRDASFALVLLTGLYLLLAALASYSFGAYIAARLRARTVGTHDRAVEFRDGMHGLIVWALATLLTAFMLIMAVQALPRLAAPSGASAGPSASVAGENIIAYDLDRLFRSERRPQGVDLSQVRSEAARILLTTSSHSGMTTEDRAYLVRLVSAVTGLSQAEADRRVTEVAATAKQNIDRARRTAVILAFFAGSVALIGALAAWYAACAGGRHRDLVVAIPEILDWDASNTFKIVRGS